MFEDWLRQGLARLLGLVLPKPGIPVFKSTETEQINMFRHHIATPPEPSVSDFAKRVATITITGVDGVQKPDTTIDVAKGSKEFIVDAEIDEVVSLVLRDFDIRNNGSDPSDPLAWKVVDTVPPPKPGELHIASVEQLDPAPAPVPPVSPPPPPPAVVPLAMSPAPLSGDAPLSVALNVSGDAALTAAFNSGEPGAADFAAPPPSAYIYITPGTYTASVKAGSETASVTITVTAPAPVPIPAG